MIAQAPEHFIDLRHPRHNPLSDTEERALLILIRKGNRAARDKLVNANLKFVVAVARKFKTARVPMVDLINEGAAGMVLAAHVFDVSSDHRFITYAVWWVRQAIVKYLHDNASTIRVPSPFALKTMVQRAEDGVRPKGRPPRNQRVTPIEQAQARVESIQSLRHLQSVEDLSASGWEPKDPTQDPTADLLRQDVKRHVAALLDGLNPKERAIVKSYFGIGVGIPMTLEEVGQRHGLTRERVRQIKAFAMERMRQESIRLEGKTLVT